MLPDIGLMQCQDMAVSMNVMHHVIHVESSYNPYAIGVVGGRLVRQPKNLPEALATVRMLEGRGYNFSLGLAQVNRYNLAKYGIESYQKAFEICPNLRAGSQILAECYRRSGSDWGKSFSCYYSGNFATGFRHGYVQKVYASIRSGWTGANAAIDPIAIPLVARRVQNTSGASRESAAVAPSNQGVSVATSTSRLAASRSDYPTQKMAVGPAPDTESWVASAQARPTLPAAGLPSTALADVQSMPSPVRAPVMLTPNGPVMPDAIPQAPSGAPVAPIVQTTLVDSAFVF